MEKKYALITGASSGFGKDFAYELSKKGYNLILVGRRENLLKEIKNDIENKSKVDVVIKIVELTHEEELDKFIKEIKYTYEVEFLINNAGYGEEDTFIKSTLENNIKMLDVHINATLKLSYEFGKEMMERRKGYIINVSSLASFLNLPSSVMYSSTKAFIRNFTESLALELMPYNIKVQALCPGFARTDFHEKLNMKSEDLKDRGLIKWMKSKDVVLYSLNAIINTKKIIAIPGLANRFLYHLIKFLPKSVYYKIMIKASNEWN